MIAGKDSGRFTHPMKAWQHNGAFVIQFLFEADIYAGRIEGRVEHVATGRAMRFCSLDELLAFLNRALKDIHESNQGESKNLPGEME